MENKNSKNVEVPYISTTAEDVTKGIADLLLVVGVIAAFVLFVTMGTERGEFNPYGFALAIGVAISSLLWWGLLRVICNISLRLKIMNDIMAIQLNAVAEGNEVALKNDSIDTTATVKEKKRVIVNAGDFVVRLKDGKKYEVKEVDGDRVFIFAGFLSGHIWLSPDQYKTLEE